MKNRLKKSEDRVAVITLLVITMVLAGLGIGIMVKNSVSTSRFYSTRALYEEYLHAIEGYVPDGSPISHITVATNFTYKEDIGYDEVKNYTTITVYLNEEMRQYTDKEAFLKLYPYDRDIQGLITTMRGKSGFGPWYTANHRSDFIYIRGEKAKIAEKTAVVYSVEGSPKLVYELVGNVFKVYRSGSERTEYTFSIDDNSLTRFEKTYPVYVPKPSTWDPHKNSTQDTPSSSVGSGHSSGRSGSSSGGSSSSRKYDYYDVYDYDSAQDFADDKYEEFYDYEDDYEDEDEAYDAAEDYWRDHH